MPHVGIDLEQFVADPYRSGIQRVLQQLAVNWPSQSLEASFVVPWESQHLLLSPSQAADLISLAFSREAESSLHEVIAKRVHRLAVSAPAVSSALLMPLFSAWLLPEVSYRPVVHQRFRAFQEVMPTAMIGYDALPMTNPRNYRFRPGQATQVSGYFRNLVRADAVVCISDYSKDELIYRLRRDQHLVTTVAHPGGDHMPVTERSIHAESPTRKPLGLLRLGTLEARKRPLDVLSMFERMRATGTDVELIIVGAPSASDESINSRIRESSARNAGVTWLDEADDDEVYLQMQKADIFLSVGTEGYGIPVLESLRLGTPVVFEGVQPAAELMVGKGAFRLTESSPSGMASEVMSLASDMSAMRDQVDPNAVPEWRVFVESVAEVCR